MYLRMFIQHDYSRQTENRLNTSTRMRVLIRNLPSWHLDLKLSSKNCEKINKSISIVEATQSMLYFVMTAPQTKTIPRGRTWVKLKMLNPYVNYCDIIVSL